MQNILIEWAERAAPRGRMTQERRIQAAAKASLAHWRKGLADLLSDPDENPDMPFFIDRARRRVREYERLAAGDTLITAEMIEGELDENLREGLAALITLCGTQDVAAAAISELVELARYLGWPASPQTTENPVPGRYAIAAA